MQNSLWEKSNASQGNAGSCGRITLLSISSHSKDNISILTCRRNNFEAMAQLALMWVLN
jgi:hypothetical protein